MNMPSKEMTSHERLLAALRGQPVDQVPWSPFLAYWWEHQPEVLQARGQIAFMRQIGADGLLRGFLTAFAYSDLSGSDPARSSEMPGVNFRREEKGGFWRCEYSTSVGTLTSTWQLSSVGNTRYLIQHPVRCKEDYKILRYIVERMIISPDFVPLQELIKDVGKDGLTVPLLSPFGKTPFQALLENFVGTEQLAYDLADFPEEIEETLAVMSVKAEQAVHLSAESPAQAFISWEDSSTTNISPALLARYIAPEMSCWGQILHDANKLLLHHACGHVQALLPILARECVDAIESLSPPPTGNVEIWEARRVMGPEMGLIGGIEPINFLNLDLTQLRGYVQNLIDRMGTHRYILANSDSCPPGVSVEKFLLISKLVKENSPG
jgi:uroporphyrinogen-III decarboxylase